MTNLMQRIAHAARKLDLAWDEADIERTWRRLVRKRRRRALRWTVLGTGAAALSLVAVLAAIEGRRTSTERAAEHSTKADTVNTRRARAEPCASPMARVCSRCRRRAR